MKSSTDLYGVSALTQSTNSSSASIATGVRSFQLKGMPVASGVVNRFDSVMMILCGLLRELLTSRKPSPPAPPALLITTSGDFMRLYLVTIPWIVRAIWSAPPPVPAGTMNSIGRDGCHWAWAGSGVSAPAIPSPVRAPNAKRVVRERMMPTPCIPTGFFVLLIGLAASSSATTARQAGRFLDRAACAENRLLLGGHLHKLLSIMPERIQLGSLRQGAL